VRFPDPKASRLVLLGVSNYEHETLDNLPAVSNCIPELRDLLTATGTGGFLSTNCLIFDDGNNNDIELERLVTQISQFASSAEDVLALWFVGHGLFDIETRKLHLALSKTDPANLYYTALPFEQLRKAFLASPAAMKILVVDCCFSGKVIAEMAMGMPDLSVLLREQVVVDGTYIMTACSGQDIALAPPGERFTAFTGGVIEALRGAVPLPMGDLFREVSRKLRGKQLPTPHQASSGAAADLALLRPGPTRHPTTVGGTFVFNPPDEPGSTSDGGLGAGANELSYAAADHDPSTSEGLEPDGPEATFGPLSTGEIQDRMRSLCSDAEAIGWIGAESSEGGNEPQPEQVIDKLRRIITDMVQLGKPDHPLVLKVRDLYAYWLSRARQHQEAARQCRRLVKARGELYGPEHGDVLASRHNLAHMIGLTGEPAEAVGQFEQVVEDRKRLLGDRHRDTLLSMAGLAYWTALNGDVLRSVDMFRDLYGDDDWWLGPNDQQTLRSLSLLAWAQGLANDPSGARDSYADLADRWAALNGLECLEALKFMKFRDYWANKVGDEP
jgi:hypothetical protein